MIVSRSVSWWFALVVAGSLVGCSRAAGDYYFADGRRIELVPSPTARAFRLKEGFTSEQLRDAVAGFDGVALEALPFLEERHHVVIVRAESDDGAVLRQLDRLREHSAVAAEVPLYASGSVQLFMDDIFAVKFNSDASAADVEAIMRSYRGRGAVFEPVPNRAGRYRVTFPDHSNQEGLAVINDLAQERVIEYATPAFVRIVANPGGMVYLRPPVPDGAGFALLSAGLPPQCANASSTTPNDSYYCHQWGLPKVNAPNAWLKTTGQSAMPVVVAVLDDGVDEDHSEFSGKIVTPSYDAVDQSDDQVPNPFDYHGTAVAGIIAAKTNNGAGMAGVSWGAQILPIKIAWTAPDLGQYAVTKWVLEDSILVDALSKAVDRGAKVVNGSWGDLGDASGPTFQEFNAEVDSAIAAGVVLVFSVGKGRTDVPWPASLAATKAVIAVSATTKADAYLVGTNHGAAVSLAAPGEEIFTTDLRMLGGSPFDYLSGDGFGETSAAAPFVSGAAALLLDKYPSASPAAIKDWLQRGADDLGDPRLGHGRLNIDGALAVASSVYVSLALTGSCGLGFSTQKTAVATVRQGGPLGPPLTGVPVSFSVRRSGTQLHTTTVVTDSSGVASVSRRMSCPTFSGRLSVSATAAGRTVSKAW